MITLAEADTLIYNIKYYQQDKNTNPNPNKINMVKRVIFETLRLNLRNVSVSDSEDFLEYRSNPEVAKYQGWEPFDLQQSIDYLNKYKDSQPGVPDKWAMFGIILKKNNKLIGDCSIKTLANEPGNAEIGCSLSPLYQGKGYAKEALSAIFDFAFGTMKIHRISGITDAKNHASIKLMQNLQMRKEGHFIKNIFFKGAWGDECLYSILEEEWSMDC